MGAQLRAFEKPAGIPVFPPHDDPAGDCVLARLLRRDPWRASMDWPKGFEGGIAHRLDTATSGALALAEGPAQLRELRVAFADGQLRKTYRLLAGKTVPWNDNEVAHPIAHDRRRKRRMVVRRGENTPHRGRWYPARTSFRRLCGSLFEATIQTGVMHQIRVHAAFVGMPLAGDALYGGGSPPPGATSRAPFLLHHVGFESDAGWKTEAVSLPAWAHAGPTQ